MDDIPIKDNKNNHADLHTFFYIGIAISLSLGVLTFYLTSKESFKNKNAMMQIVVGLPLQNSISRSITDGINLSIGQDMIIGGKRVEVVAIDTGNNEGNSVVSKEIAVAKDSAKNENVVAYIGPLTAGAADVVVPELNKGYLFNVMPVASASYLTKSGYRTGYPRLLFPTNFKSMARVSTSLDLSLHGMYDFAEEIPHKYLPLVVQNDSQQKNIFTSKSAQKLNTVSEHEFLKGVTPSTADIVVIATDFDKLSYNDIFEKILTMPNQKKISVIFNQTYDDTVEIIEFSKIFKGKIYISSSYLDSSLIKDYKTDFYNAFIDVYGYDPDKYAYAGYDSAQLVVEVLSKTSLPSRGSHLRTLSTLRLFNGATGIVPLNEFGDIRNNKIMIYKMADGTKRVEKEYVYEQ